MPVPPARWKEGLRRAAACSLHVQCSRDSFITNPKEQLSSQSHQAPILDMHDRNPTAGRRITYGQKKKERNEMPELRATSQLRAGQCGKFYLFVYSGRIAECFRVCPDGGQQPAAKRTGCVHQ